VGSAHDLSWRRLLSPNHRRSNYTGFVVSTGTGVAPAAVAPEAVSPAAPAPAGVGGVSASVKMITTTTTTTKSYE